MKSSFRLTGLIAAMLFTAVTLYAGSTPPPSGPSAPAISGVEALSNQDQTAVITGSEEIIEYRLNSGSWTPYEPPGVVISQNGGDTTYTLRARQTDSSGATSDESGITFRIDKVPPETPSVSGLSSGWKNSNQTASVSGESGAVFEYSNSGSAWAVFSNQVTFSSEGEYSVKFRQTDEAGNISPETSAYNFIIDKTPPVVDAGENITTENRVTLQGSAHDDGGIASLNWEKVSGPGSIVFGSQSEAATTVEADKQGTYILRLAAVDYAGNSAQSDMTLVWEVNAPEIQIFQGALYNSGSTYNFGEVKEGHAGVEVPFTIKNTGNVALNISSISVSDQVSFTLNSSSSGNINPGGESVFTITFTPGAEQVYNAALQVVSNDPDQPDYIINLKGTGTDGTPPDIPVVTGTSPAESKRPTWSWTSSADAAGYRYSFTDGSGWEYTASTSYTPSSDLSAGTYTLYVQAVDEAQNWSASGSKAIVVEQGQGDETPPAVMFTDPDPGSTDVPSSGEISIYFTEPIDEQSVSGALLVNGNPVNAFLSGDSTLRYSPASGFTPGSTVTVTVLGTIKDHAGNSMGSDYSFSFTVADEFRITGRYYDKGKFNHNFSDYSDAFSDNYSDVDVETHSWIVVEFSGELDPATVNNDNITIIRLNMTDNQQNNYNRITGTFELYEDSDGTVIPNKAVFKPEIKFYGNEGGSFDWNNPNWNGLKPNYEYSVMLSANIKDINGNSFTDDGEDHWIFRTTDLDYGLYFFKDAVNAVKYVPGRDIPSEYFDESKPTILYVHGWEKTSTNFQDNRLRDYRREGFIFSPGSFYPAQEAVDTVKIWKDPSLNSEGKAWNFGVMYWNQLADDDYAWLSKPQMTQAKIWTTRGQNNMSYAIRSWTGSSWSTGNVHSTKNSPSRSMSVIFGDIVADALEYNYSPEFRLVGHSLGAQMAHGIAYCLMKKHSAGEISDFIFPKRLTLIDPYWRDGSESWWTREPRHPAAIDFNISSSTPAAMSNRIAESLLDYSDSQIINGNEGNFVIEFYDVSQTSDGRVFWSNLGDPNNAGRDIAAISYLKTPWIHSDESNTDYMSYRHVNGRYYYFWSYAYPAPSEGFSASTPDSSIRPLMNYYRSSNIRFSITGGAHTPDPGDDVYTRYNGSWQK